MSDFVVNAGGAEVAWGEYDSAAQPFPWTMWHWTNFVDDAEGRIDYVGTFDNDRIPWNLADDDTFVFAGQTYRVGDLKLAHLGKMEDHVVGQLAAMGVADATVEWTF